MIEAGIKGKVARLREVFFGEDPTALKQIDEWDKRIIELSKSQDFMRNEVAQEMVQALKARVKNHILYRLQKGRKPEELTLSDAKEEECRWMLSLFNPDYQSELETLESLIDAEL